MYGIKNEIQAKFSDEYSDFGKPYTEYPTNIDHCECCLPGNFMKCHSLTNIDMCPEYMAQRCADTWDEKCTIYRESITDTNDLHNFLNNTLSKKYLKLRDDSNCSVSCQPFDPISQESEMVCSIIGNEVLHDTSNTIDVGDNKSVVISGEYMGKCLLENKNIPVIDGDIVLDSCIKNGACKDTISTLCKGGNIKNKSLTDVCMRVQEKFSNGSKFATTAQIDMSPPGTYKPSNGYYKYIPLLLAIIVCLWVFFKRS